MFTITRHTKANHEFVTLSNKSASEKAVICLDQGGRVVDLILHNEQLLYPYSMEAYDAFFASAILFPFANRIKNGAYRFENNDYQLPKNEIANGNAIHGLVYNKTFEIVKTVASEFKAEVILEYKTNGADKGFPFSYSLQLKYSLSKKNFILEPEITNLDSKTFPFTIGWHPYFIYEEQNDNKIVFDKSFRFKYETLHKSLHMEALNGKVEIDLTEGLDEAFQLNNKQVRWTNKSWILNLLSSEDPSFLQLFRPKESAIAIEPMTGIADSFHHHIGLKQLAPQETYSLSWQVYLEKPTRTK